MIKLLTGVCCAGAVLSATATAATRSFEIEVAPSFAADMSEALDLPVSEVLFTLSFDDEAPIVSRNNIGFTDNPGVFAELAVYDPMSFEAGIQTRLQSADLTNPVSINTVTREAFIAWTTHGPTAGLDSGVVRFLGDDRQQGDFLGNFSLGFGFFPSTSVDPFFSENSLKELAKYLNNFSLLTIEQVSEVFLSFDLGREGPDERVLANVVNITETSPIPLPAAAWMFGVAAPALLAFNRRKKAKA